VAILIGKPVLVELTSNAVMLDNPYLLKLIVLWVAFGFLIGRLE